MDNDDIWARVPRWQRVPWYYVAVPALCLVGILLSVRDSERIPDDAEELTDLAKREKDPRDWAYTKGTLPVEDGGVLVFYYSPLSDSGVDLQRLGPDGRIIWEQRCDPIAVKWHSSYLHRVSVFVEGRTIRVVSRGSHGAFVERLSLRSGQRLARSVRKPIDWPEWWPRWLTF